MQEIEDTEASRIFEKKRLQRQLRRELTARQLAETLNAPADETQAERCFRHGLERRKSGLFNYDD